MVPSAETHPVDARHPAPLRCLLETGAVLAGAGMGVAFAEPVLGAAGALWRGYVLPAYDEVIRNGMFAWCM
jgi:hypothetical protein